MNVHDCNCCVFIHDDTPKYVIRGSQSSSILNTSCVKSLLLIYTGNKFVVKYIDWFVLSCCLCFLTDHDNSNDDDNNNDDEDNSNNDSNNIMAFKGAI